MTDVRNKENGTKDKIVLRTRNITKIYPGTVALDDIDFNVYLGKVNVLVGENGAGKSTLMKILAGIEHPTRGEILLKDTEVNFKSSRDASEAGIGIIHQELNLFANLNVSENIFIGREKSRYGYIDHRAQEEAAVNALKRLEHRIDPKTLVKNLRIGEQQIVEIAKTLLQESDILIMDEPTSALSNEEVEVLFQIIDDLKKHHVSIIYISHRMDELLRIGDYITVLRDGHKIAEAPMKDIDLPWIIEQMVGKNDTSTLVKKGITELRDVALKVENLSLPKKEGGFLLKNVSFSLRSGEILGLYGLRGAGRTELLECLFGLHKNTTGNITLDGELIKNEDINQRIRKGITLVPEDRQREGLCTNLSVMKNTTLASLYNMTKGFHLIKRKESEATNQKIKELSVKVADYNLLISSLSGGNQQKVIVGKSLLTNPKVLLLDEPTRGIDVAAKGDIFNIMCDLANQGYAIIFVASELKEIMSVSDRIIVMSKGKITGGFPITEASEEALVTASAAGHGIDHGSD
ncbi:MAG: sugar ABC transporter ATP-binding protein [Spirochaetales bacterium]|nr:sugar ABC transporter ATP-binding protein [Spirochaetales bacterium]